jgi:DNA modification methylase
MTILLVNANSLHIPLTDKSVQCCVTSPPYYGLRDYQTAKWEGGSPECDHKAPPAGGIGESSKLQLKTKRIDFASGFYKSTCGKCGALRVDNQIGLEETPELYVSKLVEVFREVWRVMKDDGTLWLNLGDSYWANRAGNGEAGGEGRTALSGRVHQTRAGGRPRGDIKPKDLIGIPWMVAFALRADGWYLRSDIIWAKSNPMPESVTDRPTKSHEYIFLLSKSASYYYDAEAIKEPAKYSASDRIERAKGNHKSNPDEKRNGIRVRKPAGWDISRQGAHGAFHRDGRSLDVEYTTTHAETRNKRSVWTVATKPYVDAHFATFPPALIEPCILAGSRVGNTILDPFGGSGTTSQVARLLKRHSVCVDLSLSYLREQARTRLQLTALEEFQNGKKVSGGYDDLPLFMDSMQ